MKRYVVLLTMVVLLLLTARASAMNSTNYRLDWFTPLTTAGGGPAGSANYDVNFSIGQTVIGSQSSANYGIGLGYWYGAGGSYSIYLPLVLKNA